MKTLALLMLVIVVSCASPKEVQEPARATIQGTTFIYIDGEWVEIKD